MSESTKSPSLKQIAYARRIFGAQGKTKKEIALDVGFSPSAANSIKHSIESKPGFHMAIAQLAADSNNLALSVMEEIKARGFRDYTNKEVVQALTAIANAWSKFNGLIVDKEVSLGNPKNSNNRLRTIIHQRIENQVINTSPQEVKSPLDNAIPAEFTEVPADEVENVEDIEGFSSLTPELQDAMRQVLREHKEARKNPAPSPSPKKKRERKIKNAPIVDLDF